MPRFLRVRVAIRAIGTKNTTSGKFRGNSVPKGWWKNGAASAFN